MGESSYRVVPSFVQLGLAEDDVVLHGHILDPRLLAHVRERSAVETDVALDLVSLAKNCGEEGRFAGPDSPDDGDERALWRLEINVFQDCGLVLGPREASINDLEIRCMS